MKFIKSVSPEDPVIKPIMDEFGFDGYGRFVAVLQFCRNYEIETLDLETIVKQAKTNKRGAQKLLPKFQECLGKVLEKFGESFSKVSPKFDQSLPKLEGQNPHGSTHDLEENRAEKTREENATNPNGLGQSPRHPIWADGLELLTQNGDKESFARSFLGRAVKEYGEGAVGGAISACILECPVEPKAFLIACLKQKPKLGKPTTQTGLTLGRPKIVPASERKGGVLEL